MIKKIPYQCSKPYEQKNFYFIFFANAWFFGESTEYNIINEYKGDKVYIYPKTVKTDETKGYISAWFLTKYKVAKKLPSGKYYTSVKYQELMDCDNMESGTVSIALYPKKWKSY